MGDELSEAFWLRPQHWPRHWLASTPGRKCPECGKFAGRPIMFGLPTSYVRDAIAQGVIDVVIGGCVIEFNAPSHECSDCGVQFAAPEEKVRYEVLFQIETDAADDDVRDAVNAAWYAIEEALGVEPDATARTVDVDGKIGSVEWDDWDGDGTSFSVRRDS